ncbi:MAG: type II toxin-antitoxin system RelE/ParE family toxin [Lentisphaeraceae bacterium]|nr:type II toxin-antitoxin system RelE/ParE family toxin [Lentisphaeraceae bacterium]
MTIRFSPEFKKNLFSFIEFFQKEDAYQGTSLVEDFRVDLGNTIEMTKAFPDAFPEFVPRIRRISLKKFKNHCIRYSFDETNETIIFLTITHYAQNS